MANISKYYRNDSSDGLDDELREYLDAEFFSKLDYINEKNPKLLVVFAGGNAVGKSTLSQKINQELHGLRIENDGVKRAILKIRPELAMTEALHQLTWKYTMDVYKRLDQLTANGLVIRDGIITWYYDRILPIFLEGGYQLFIVGYDLSEQKMRELIKSRGDTATSTEERFYDLIQDQQVHLKRFYNHYKADILLNDDTVFDHDSVVAAIYERVEQLRAESK